MNTQQIEALIDGAKTAGEAVAKIIESESKVGVGTKVAVIDDPTAPIAGAVGTVKSCKPGFCVVSLANGTEITVQSDILIPV